MIYLNDFPVEVITFPDGQLHVSLLHHPSFVEDGVGIKCNVRLSIKNPNDLFALMLLSDAIDNASSIKNELKITYLMGSRSDRVFEAGDSFDLKVVANCINILGFEKVCLLDCHSNIATELINNSTNIEPIRLWSNSDGFICIAPDVGAYKRIGNPDILCIKHRNSNGKIIDYKIIDQEKCHEQNCAVIDDICDGGATFIELAKTLQANNIKPKSLILVVTHGVFSKGFGELFKYYDRIITTDSYFDKKVYDKSRITVVKTEDL